MATSLVRKSLDEAIDHAVEGDRHHCVTLEARGDDSRWVQLTWDYVNVSYPSDEEPSVLLENMGIRLPKGITLERWERNKFATFEHPADPVEEIVRFVELYFEKVLGIVPSPFTIKVTSQSLRE